MLSRITSFQTHYTLHSGNHQLNRSDRKYPLVILSNRLPGANDAGGVVKLLASMSIPQTVIWAGPGAVVPDEKWSPELPPQIRSYRDQFLLVQYPVPATLKQAHYSIIANGVLWAALHGLEQQFNENIETLFGQTNPESQFSEAFAKYWQFNEIATKVVDRWIEPGGIVWCIDYQMVGVRSTIAGTRIMYSNCTPIPEVKRLSQMYVGSKTLLELPDFKKWIAQLCQYHLVALQRFHDLENLLAIGLKLDSTLKKIDLSKNIYYAFGNRVRLVDIPLGQNVKSLRTEANVAKTKYDQGRLSQTVKDLIDRHLIHQACSQKNLALVSRNDYTKGIRETIAAVNAYFQMYSGDVKFLFILQPARTQVVGYEKYRQMVDREMETLRATWAEKVVYVNQGIPHDELMLLLRNYIDFVLIMATHTDGHNLIAPEMLKVSPRNSRKGVIAVEGAGMTDYIGFENIFLCQDLSNANATAAVFAEAINMPGEQLIARFNRMQRKSLRINDRTYFNAHVNALLEGVVL
ncbi:trehalose-6-phosphate synthase [Oculatella sp. LEGE 06141]|uniref:trehalose-6-phosphate synthase n=1 Tax=Oculatella sp. LEGE 06141 TaxID=1828648 RepID=UPI001D1540D3|nr:trehalose-6-phosphate synthase [Oculatella sp. LEGE 06141]